MFEWVLIVILGLVFGSFANVCIYRIPKNISIVTPRSACPKCGRIIPWYDNIPVLSFILLGGRCRYCKDKISVRYPVIELSCAALFAYIYFCFGYTYILPVFLFLAFILLISTAVDFELQIIPDEFSFTLMAAGLLTSFLNTTLADSAGYRILNSFLGFLAGGGFLFLVAVVGKYIFNKDAMGGGDIKLMAGVGAFIGWENVLFAIFIASFLGSVAGIMLILLKKISRKQAIPFGPYLAAGSLLTFILPSPGTLINALFVIEEKFLMKYLFSHLFQ